jgi:rfaE bifunctional protein nucleotidyltransferase chain/domain
MKAARIARSLPPAPSHERSNAGRPDRPSCSLMASSTSCTPATSGTSSRPAGWAMRSSSASTRTARSPITPEAERAEILSALDCVDEVVIFDEDTPHAIIAALQPDVLVKGAGWAEDAIVGRDIVEARGGRVVRVETEPGHSTSRIIDRIRMTQR